MAEHERGQVDTSGAEVYDEFFVPALFGRFSEAVLEGCGLQPGDDVVDVACGTGALTRLLRTRTGGRVVGVDLNPGMLAVARRHDDDIDYREADAVDLPFADDEFALATCQFGLMFLPDPAAGVVEMSRVARRGAAVVWDAIDRSDGYSEMQELFRAELGDDAAASLDAPFAMGAGGVLERVLSEAGVDRAELSRIEGTGRFESIDAWVTTEVRGWTLGESITDEQLDGLLAVARTRLAPFATADGCVFGMAARLATWVA